jgi:hypothetical protein
MGLDKMRVILTFAIWLLASSLALAQDPRIPVAVSHSGHDKVGQQLAFALKEAIRGSRSFRFVDHEIGPTSPRIVVYLVSIDSDVSGVNAAISNAIIYDHVSIPGWGIILSLGVQSCSQDRVETCAKEILPNINSGVEALRKGWPDLWRSLVTDEDRYTEEQTPERRPLFFRFELTARISGNEKPAQLGQYLISRFYAPVMGAGARSFQVDSISNSMMYLPKAELEMAE